MVDRDRAGRAGAATVSGHRGALAWSAMVSWVLRVATAAALGVDAVVHWQNAPAYDAVAGTISQGALFRAEAAVAVAVGLLILVRPRTSGWVAAGLVAASALGAVVLYRYVDLGALGPLPDMYEDTWQVPGKLLSAWAEGAAVVLAGLGLLTHCKHLGGNGCSYGQQYLRGGGCPPQAGRHRRSVELGAAAPAAGVVSGLPNPKRRL